MAYAEVHTAKSQCLTRTLKKAFATAVNCASVRKKKSYTQGYRNGTCDNPVAQSESYSTVTMGENPNPDGSTMKPPGGKTFIDLYIYKQDGEDLPGV